MRDVQLCFAGRPGYRWNIRLRPIREMVDVALKALSPSFDQMYATFWTSVDRAGETAASLAGAGAVYGVRSERMLMEQLQYNLLFRWFVGDEYG